MKLEDLPKINLESAIKAINKRLTDIYNFFGAKSIEYHEARTTLFSSLGSDVDILLRTHEKGKPIQLSRSKNAMRGWKRYEFDLKFALVEMRKSGTVRQMAQSILDEFNFESKEVTGDAKKHWKSWQQEIKDFTKAEYEAKYGDSDLYEQIVDEMAEENSKDESIRDDMYITELGNALDCFRGHAQREYRYARAEDAFLKAKADHEIRMRSKLTEDSDEPADVEDKLDMSL